MFFLYQVKRGCKTVTYPLLVQNIEIYYLNESEQLKKRYNLKSSLNILSNKTFQVWTFFRFLKFSTNLKKSKLFICKLILTIKVQRGENVSVS